MKCPVCRMRTDSIISHFKTDHGGIPSYGIYNNMRWWKAIVIVDGKVHHLGETDNHYIIIKKANLESEDYCQIEISPKEEFDYLSPINADRWNLKIDWWEKPAWWTKRHEDASWNAIREFYSHPIGKRFIERFKRAKSWVDGHVTKTADQYFYATSLDPKVKDMIKRYYDRDDWDKVVDGVWHGGIANTVWDELRAYAFVNSCDIFHFRKEFFMYTMYKISKIVGMGETKNIRLPVDIFEAGVCHAMVKEMDGFHIKVFGGGGNTILDDWITTKE